MFGFLLAIVVSFMNCDRIPMKVIAQRQKQCGQKNLKWKAIDNFVYKYFTHLLKEINYVMISHSFIIFEFCQNKLVLQCDVINDVMTK